MGTQQHRRHDRGEAVSVDVVATAEELADLPRGVVVRSSSGTIASKFDTDRGVVFGDDRSFPWSKLSLPCKILWHPAWALAE